MSRERCFTACTGAYFGIALFGCVSHVLLLAGARVLPLWFPICLAIGIVAGASRAPSGTASSDRAPRWVVTAALLVLAVVLASIAHGSIATISREWDGAASWAPRARALADAPTLEQPFFREPAVFAHTREYPLLQPLCLASLSGLLGPGGSGILFPALLALLLATFALGLCRGGAGALTAWLCVVALGLTPMLVSPTSGSFDSGFGDAFTLVGVTGIAIGLVLADPVLLWSSAVVLPMIKPEGAAYGLLAIAVAWLRLERRAHAAVVLGWAIGVGLWLPLYASLVGQPSRTSAVVSIAAAVIAATALATKEWLVRSRPGPALRSAVLAGLAIGSAIALFALRDTIAGPGVIASYLSGAGRALERLTLVPAILVGAVAEMFAVRKFGLGFAIVVLLALAPRGYVGRCPSPALAWLLAFAAAFLLVPFLLSPETELAHHLRSSMDRLLMHWIGVVWLLIGLWIAPLLVARAARSPAE